MLKALVVVVLLVVLVVVLLLLVAAAEVTAREKNEGVGREEEGEWARDGGMETSSKSLAAAHRPPSSLPRRHLFLRGKVEEGRGEAGEWAANEGKETITKALDAAQQPPRILPCRHFSLPVSPHSLWTREAVGASAPLQNSSLGLKDPTAARGGSCPLDLQHATGVKWFKSPQSFLPFSFLCAGGRGNDDGAAKVNLR
jgi:hypothetical protein